MLTAGLMITGCYNKFDEVPPLVTYDSKEAFEEAFPECEYKTIEELNRRWNLNLFSQAYDRFEQIPAPEQAQAQVWF